MRIISQDKTYSCEFQEHDLRIQAGIIYAVSNPRDIVLGSYVTDARAKEVLTDIHNHACYEMKMLPEMLVYEMPWE